MTKVKFYYNEETCKYEPIIPGASKIVWNILGFIGLSLLLAGGLIWGYHTYFTPVKESMLLSENQELVYDYKLLNSKIEAAKAEVEALAHRDDHVYRTILDMEPIAPTMRQAGVGGSNLYVSLEEAGLESSDLILDTYKDLDKVKQQMYIQTRSYDDIEDNLFQKQKMWASKPAITPLAMNDVKRFGSGFRWRTHPLWKVRRFHWGVDISADRGKPIYATGDGWVKKKYYSKSYGNVVFIDHGFGYETRYAHMVKFNVEEGQKVKRGDIIGFIGSTGWSTAPHLHYEVTLNGQHVDPVPYLSKNLSKEEFEKIIEISQTSDLVLDY